MERRHSRMERRFKDEEKTIAYLRMEIRLKVGEKT